MFCAYQLYRMTHMKREVEVIRERERAGVLLHPLRLRILEAARDPASSAGLARRLGLKAQKVNYHVQRLSEAGFLVKVEERRAGNILETVYGASAESYVLASGVLGPLSPPQSASGVTAGRLLALQARAEEELGRVMEQAGVRSGTIGALSLDEEFLFETAEQRSVFTRAVRELFSAVVRKYTSPERPAAEEPAGGRAYRMILGCYPLPDEGRGGEGADGEGAGPLEDPDPGAEGARILP